MPKPIIYDDQYTGDRWRYGQLHGRVQSLFGRPDGVILFSDRPDARFPFGTADYPFALSDEECFRFDLVLVEVIPAR